MGVYDDLYGGIPPVWEPDPMWVPPPHWGYGDPSVAPQLDPAAAPQPIDSTGSGMPVLDPDPAVAPIPVVEPGATAPMPNALAAPSLPGPPVAPPPIPMPDAVSAAAPQTLPLPEIAPERLDVSPQTPADQFARDPLRSPIEADARAAAEGMSTADLLNEQRKIDVARQNKLLLDQARAEEENLRQVQVNVAALRAAAATAQSKSDQIVADAMALAGTKIDPDRLMSRMSGGQTAAQILAVAVGGLVAGRTGGPNAAMDLFQKRVDRDIAAQVADIENAKFGINVRKSAVAEEYARHGDLYRAAETVRLATYQAAINKMQTEQQNFDTRGTPWVQYGKEIKKAQADMAAAAEAARKTIFDESYKVEELRLRAQAQADARKAQQQQLGLGYAQLQSAAADRKAAADARADEKATKRADEEAERSRQFSLSAPRAELAMGADGKPVIGPDGKPVTVAKKLLNADGKEWRLGSPERTAAMEAKLVTSSEISDIIDEVKDIRANIGKGVLPWTEARQRLTVLEERATTIAKAGTQGMSSDNDFKALRKSVGADDFKSFMDISATLDEARNRTQSALNTAMRAANYTGPPLTFPNKYTGTTNTPEDDRQKALKVAPDVSLEDVINANIKKFEAERGWPLNPVHDPADREPFNRIRDETTATFDPGATPEQRADIAKLGADAKGGDASARAVLDDIAKSAGNARLRGLAKAEIEALKSKPTANPRGPRSTEFVAPDELRLP